MSETITSPPRAPNYTFPGRETPGQDPCVCAVLAAPVGQGDQHSAHIADQRVRDEWVCWTFAGRVEHFHVDSAIGRWIVAQLELLDSRWAPTSKRTERRHRGERKGEIAALVARDGRTTTNSARQRVVSRKTTDSRKWLKVCDGCGEVFEAVRSDARFHDNACRVRAARRSS